MKNHTVATLFTLAALYAISFVLVHTTQEVRAKEALLLEQYPSEATKMEKMVAESWWHMPKFSDSLALTPQQKQELDNILREALLQDLQHRLELHLSMLHPNANPDQLEAYLLNRWKLQSMRANIDQTAAKRLIAVLTPEQMRQIAIQGNVFNTPRWRSIGYVKRWLVN